MRVSILAPVLAFSFLLFTGCAEEKPASEMPVTTDSELAQEFYETGMIAYDQLKLAQAKLNFKYAIKEDPNFFMAYFWMFFISNKDSKQLVDKALNVDMEFNPGEEQIRMVLKYLVDGQNEKVVEHLNKLIDLYPSDPHAYKLLYIIQFHYFKEVEAAIISIERAIQQIPDYPLAYNQMGYAYIDLEDYENAEKALDTYIKLAPGQPNPFDSKGDYFMATEQYEEAYHSYMKAFELDSGFDMSKKKAKKARWLQEKAAKN